MTDAAATEPIEDELARSQIEHAEKKKRTGKVRIVGIGASIAIIAVVFAYVLPKIADYGEVWGVVTRMSWEWIVGLMVITVVNVLTNALPWMAALPGISFFHALRVACASSALSLVAPGGTAVAVATQYGMLKSWGFEGRPVGLAVGVTNIWGQLITYGFPVLALGALTAQGGRNSTLDWVALIGLGVFILIVAGFTVGLASERLTDRIGNKAAQVVTWLKHVIRKGPVGWSGADFVRFREEAIDLLRKRWHVLTITMIASQLAVFLVLLATLRAVGVHPEQVSVVEAFAAWSLIRALGSIPITPGGFGIEEVALTGALVGFGAGNAEAVAATLVYRFLTVVPTLVVGLAAAATYRLGKPKQAAVPA